MVVDIQYFQHRFVPSSGSVRTLLMLHGTGGTEDDLIPIAKNLDPLAAIISPRGRVSENGMPRFFRRLAEGVFDIPDLIERSNELADWIGAAAMQYAFDLSKLVAVGYSNGANIAGGVILLRPGVITTAILLRPMVPFVPPVLPDLSAGHVLIAAGAFDPIAPKPQIEALERLLKSCGVSVTTHTSDASHGLVKEDIDVSREWLEQ